MPQLSPLEILVVATIALIVFGPEKLPQIARTIGRGASELRRMASEVKDEFQVGLDIDDDEPPKKVSRRPHPNVLATPKADTDTSDVEGPDQEQDGLGPTADQEQSGLGATEDQEQSPTPTIETTSADKPDGRPDPGS